MKTKKAKRRTGKAKAKSTGRAKAKAKTKAKARGKGKGKGKGKARARARKAATPRAAGKKLAVKKETITTLSALDPIDVPPSCSKPITATYTCACKPGEVIGEIEIFEEVRRRR